MLESIQTQNQFANTQAVSRPAYEVRHFMDNFFEAIADGNHEEVATYYSDETQPLYIPFNVNRKQNVLLVDDHLATFSCVLETQGVVDKRFTCVLDKSEGYWQIIHCQLNLL